LYSIDPDFTLLDQGWNHALLRQIKPILVGVYQGKEPIIISRRHFLCLESHAVMEVTGNPAAQADFDGLAVLSAGLARSLAEENADSNLVFSPLSIYAALALLAAGAGGDTLDEILRVLGAQSRAELEEFIARVTGPAVRASRLRAASGASSHAR
jgi:serine protease inhibitor